ncbi:MAG: hypothetical protein R3C05_13435 [Pirellulaceae bacterium]
MRIGLTHLLLCIAGTVLVTGCAPVRHNLPPAERLMQPGPGVGGPGPGVMAPPAMQMGGGMMGGPMGPGAMMAAPMMGGGPTMGGPAGLPPGSGPGPQMAQGDSSVQQVAFNGMYGQGISSCLGSSSGCGCSSCAGGDDGGGGEIMQTAFQVNPTVQVTFARPDSMHVQYDATGSGMFDSEPLVVPARQNFPAGGLYRLKLTNIVGREGVELYPTLEIAPPNPRTGAYLAHNSIPIQITEEDLDQVLTGNFVTKVIYLPDRDFQGPALAGIDTLVSTRLDPGVDPIVEADRRGSILAILRLGDKDIEMAGVADGQMMGVPMAGYPMGAGGMAMGAGCGDGSCGPMGCGPAAIPGGAALPPQLPGMIAGITAPQYGMPITGTPIGLPGPPHIPLGGPASLKSHSMHNRTHAVMPQPVQDIKIGVKLQPGYSYPHPVSRINIVEQNIHPGTPYGRPGYTKPSQAVSSPNAPGTVPGGGAYCPPE